MKVAHKVRDVIEVVIMVVFAAVSVISYAMWRQENEVRDRHKVHGTFWSIVRHNWPEDEDEQVK